VAWGECYRCDAVWAEVLSHPERHPGGRGLGGVVEHVAEVSVERPGDGVDDDAGVLVAVLDQQRRRVPAGQEVGAYTGREHGVPAPQRPLPERRAEERDLRLAGTLLVATPCVVDEQVEATAFASYPREQCRAVAGNTVASSSFSGPPGLGGLRSVEAMKTTTPLLVLSSVACAQVGGAIARTLFDDLGPPGVLLLRLAIAASIFTVAVRPRIRSWTASAWRSTALLGVFSAGLNLLSYLALSIAPQGIVVTVSFVGPLVLSLVQTRRPADLLWALMAGTGVVLLGLRAGVDVPLPGLLLALAAGACGAGYIMFSARVGAVVPGLGGLAVSFAVGALMVLPFGAAGVDEVFRHPRLVPGLVTVAVLSSVVPYALELIALRHMTTRVFGVLMSLQPAAAAIAGLLILHQRLGPAPIAALVLVTVASIGVTRRSSREPLQPPRPVR
jgi:inner membrane transporter RhtA